MATDNVPINPGSGGPKVATRGVNYSGEEAAAQAVGLVMFSGPDDGKTATDVNPENPLPVAAYGELVESIEALRMAVQSLTRSGLGQSMPDTAMRLRVVVDAITGSLTLSTVNTVNNIGTITTLTNQTQIGGNPANDQIPALMRMAADSARRNISTS
jgi:hypothetical protein